MQLKELIEEACEGVGEVERQTILATGNLVADGVPFTFVPGTVGTDDASSLYLYCDFGELPPEQTEAALKRLLEINLFLYGRDAPTFVFNSVTAHVLLACRLEQTGLTAQRFVQSLREMGVYAREWQASYFLANEEVVSPAPFSPGEAGKAFGQPDSSTGSRS
jgi:hypothetical protein